MKKRILSLLLALLMVLGMVPMPFAAADDTAGTAPAACPVCGAENCTVQHVYCEVCSAYDCGVDHSAVPASEPVLPEVTPCPVCTVPGCEQSHLWCDSCQKYDCGLSHDADTAGDADTPDTSADTADTSADTAAPDGSAQPESSPSPSPAAQTPAPSPAPNHDADIGKYARLNADCTDEYITGFDGAQLLYFPRADFAEGLILTVAGWHVEAASGTLWYSFTAHEGSLPEAIPENCWLLQNTIGSEDPDAFEFITIENDDADSTDTADSVPALCTVCGLEPCICPPADDADTADDADSADVTGTQPEVCTRCGVNPCICVPMTSTGPKTTSTPDYSANVGKYAQFDSYWQSIELSSDPSLSGNRDFCNISVIPDGIIVHIIGCYVSSEDNSVWYKVEAADGYELSAVLAASPWVFQNYVNGSDIDTLYFVDFQPENPCGCCEACNGKEGCECECEDCTFKSDEPEEPEVPELVPGTITGSVNGQTVTVSGDLPVGATLNVIPVANEAAIKAELGMEGGFLWDIKVYDSNGNEWQPANGETVMVTLPVYGAPDGSYVDIEHFPETVNGVYAALAKSSTLVGSADDFPTTASALAPAVLAWQNATGSSENNFVYERIMGLTVNSGVVSFAANSFSIYRWDNGFSHTRYESANTSNMMVVCKGNDDNVNGETFYITNGQAVVFSAGIVFPQERRWGISGAGQSFSDKSSSQASVTVSGASMGDTFQVEYWGATSNNQGRIYFVVVEERTVNYNGNGGTPGVASDVAVTDGGSHNQNVIFPNATRTGYSFNGWYTAASGGTRVGGSGTSYMPASNGVTLYAQWSPITYKVHFNANGGSGSMADQTMTYDKGAPLNANQFSPPAAGYVFTGWSTSAGGSVVHRNGASVSNLANTQDAVVNLYAVWVNTMEIDVIGIGLNESYWYTNFMYTVTASGAASSSYHAFPNEPAQQSIRYMRPVGTIGGSWSITENTELSGKASAYIDASIVSSQKFVHSYITNQDTYGVADSTGVDVKAFLKFTAADYQNIIKVWLQNMADRTADTSNGDGTWNIENKGSTYKTDVNWNEEVNNWADYEIIPYVIKLENSNTWRIDMVAVPSRYVTLSYDLNINTTAGYSLTAGSSIPNAQYERDSVRNVYASPTAYDSTTKVSKTVGGVEYVAEFLYWEDAQGNKYGTGYNTAVTMDGNKTLKAVWRYPDQTQGALRVEKDLTVPTGSGITPNTNQAFSITVTLGTSGSYPYTLYSRTGIASGTGTLSGESGTFSLKADEYVIITGINAGVSYTVNEAAVTGYTNKSGTVSGSIQAGNTAAVNIVNQRNAYTVTWKDENGTVLETDRLVEYGATPTYNGSTPSKAADAQYTYSFTGWSPAPAAVTADATYTAQYSETLNKYTVTFVDEDGTVLKAATQYDYGTKAADISKPADPSKAATAEYTYSFSGWTPAVADVTGNATYKAMYTAEKNKYTVTWLNDDGSLIDTTTVAYGDVPSHAAPSKAATAEYSYSFSHWTPNVVAVTGDATYTAVYTAVKNKYTVTWKNEDGTVLETDTGVEYGTMPTYNSVTPTKESTDKDDFVFHGWSPSLETVTGNVTYTATFDPKLRYYPVYWVNEDGTPLETDESVAYGTIPTYDGAEPTKEGNAQFSYEFAGWSPTVSAVTGAATYTATFNESVNKYTVVWKNEDGTVLETDENVQYNATPSYDGDTPTKAETEWYTYTFTGWTPEISPVTSDVIYTAVYSEQAKNRTLTGEIEHGTVTGPVTVLYDERAELTFNTDTGYRMVSWSDNKGSTGTFGSLTQSQWIRAYEHLRDDVVVTVVTAPIDYSITYDLGGGALADDVTNPASYNIESGDITLNNPTREGYDFAGWTGTDLTEATETVTIPTGSTGDREYIATWTEKTATLTYTVETVDGQTHGKVKLNGSEEAAGETVTETVAVVTGTALGAEAVPDAGYEFVGWYDEDGDEVSKDKIFVPTKDEDSLWADASYTAKFKLALVDLTITTSCNDAKQSFIFEVTRLDDGTQFGTFTQRVVLVGNDTQLIRDIPVGSYTVTEIDNWSWRHNEEAAATVILDSSKTLTFAFGAVENNKWLSGCSTYPNY